jgi:hypothetical protein
MGRTWYFSRSSLERGALMMILLCEEGAWKWAFLAFLLDEETFLLYFIFYGGRLIRTTKDRH